MNAHKFFKMEVVSGWGYMVKERKTLTKDEERKKQAVRALRNGIKEALEI